MDEKERTRGILSSKAKIFFGIMLLVIGCLIYLLFRSKTLYIYVWCKSLGMSSPIDTLRIIVNDWSVPSFIKYSLPDGLYCTSYLLIMDAIWHEEKSWLKYLILAVVPLITIDSEILQYFGYVRGTFDLVDLFCYLVPPLLYVICFRPMVLFEKQNKNKS